MDCWNTSCSCFVNIVYVKMENENGWEVKLVEEWHKWKDLLKKERKKEIKKKRKKLWGVKKKKSYKVQQNVFKKSGNAEQYLRRIKKLNVSEQNKYDSENKKAERKKIQIELLFIWNWMRTERRNWDKKINEKN